MKLKWKLDSTIWQGDSSLTGISLQTNSGKATKYNETSVPGSKIARHRPFFLDHAFIFLPVLYTFLPVPYAFLPYFCRCHPYYREPGTGYCKLCLANGPESGRK